MDYRKKYLKYKNKYLELKSYSQIGGGDYCNVVPDGRIQTTTFDGVTHQIICYKVLAGHSNVNLMRNMNNNTFIMTESNYGLIYKSNYDINTIGSHGIYIFEYILDYFYSVDNNMRQLLRNKIGGIDKAIGSLMYHLTWTKNKSPQDALKEFENIYFGTTTDLLLGKIN